MRKWNSRKLIFAILTPLLGAWQPELIPLLKILAPAYLIGQSVVDSGITATLIGKSGNS